MSARPKRQKLPVALTIAGSDSGGGAGIQADLKTFASLGVHGTSAITCLTAQTPKDMTGIQACRPNILRAQIEAVLTELAPRAVKTGMLFSTPLIRVVVEFFATGKHPPLIVDPVMIATSGARLLSTAAVWTMQQELLPRAALVTPNLGEAEVLIDQKLRTVDDLRQAAREIRRRFGCAALVKGGHLVAMKEAVDIFYDGRTELVLASPFIKGVFTHGTGCAYSAAIAGHVARGCDLPRAVRLAKEYITQAIAQRVTAGKHTVLNSFWKR